jgi:hypothetical protein
MPYETHENVFDFDLLGIARPAFVSEEEEEMCVLPVLPRSARFLTIAARH